MAQKFCSNCGTEQVEGSRFCHACGAQTEPQTAPQQIIVPVQTTYLAPQKKKVPGRGMAIAAMVLGIIGVVSALGSIGELFVTLESGYCYMTKYELISEFIMSILVCILPVIFGIVARKKGYTGGMATAGIATALAGFIILIAVAAVYIASANVIEFASWENFYEYEAFM